MIYAELLNQLQAKDPELWEKINRVHQMRYLRQIDDPQILEFLAGPEKQSIIQGYLQDAIRARGYGYGMEYYHGPRMVGVSIYKWGNGFEKITIGAGYRTTEAEALLRAYLAAIEAVKV